MYYVVFKIYNEQAWRIVKYTEYVKNNHMILSNIAKITQYCLLWEQLHKHSCQGNHQLVWVPNLYTFQRNRLSAKYAYLKIPH